VLVDTPTAQCDPKGICGHDFGSFYL
jgi:hypothetical protein